MKINASRRAGFTLVEIMIVVAIIGLLAAIAVPNFVRSHLIAQKNACMANLKQIDGAKASWALEQKKTNTDTVATTDLYGNTCFIRVAPECPSGGSYTLGTVQERVLCSLSSTATHTY